MLYRELSGTPWSSRNWRDTFSGTPSGVPDNPYIATASVTKFFSGVPDIGVGVPDNGALLKYLPHHRELHGVPEIGEHYFGNSNPNIGNSSKKLSLRSKVYIAPIS